MPRSIGEALAELLTSVATLEQDTAKIAADVLKLSEKLKKTNRRLLLVIDASGALHQAEHKLGAAVDALESQARERLLGGAVGGALEKADTMMRTLRNEIAGNDDEDEDPTKVEGQK